MFCVRRSGSGIAITFTYCHAIGCGFLVHPGYLSVNYFALRESLDVRHRKERTTATYPTVSGPAGASEKRGRNVASLTSRCYFGPSLPTSCYMHAQSWVWQAYVLRGHELKTTTWIIVGLALVGVFFFFFQRARDSAESTAQRNALLKKEQQRKIASALSPSSAATTEPVEPVASTKPMLEESQQKHIWDLEHYTFELEWKFGKQVKDAIGDKDKEKLLTCFLADADGSIPAWEDERHSTGTWWRQYDLDSGADDRRVSAEQVADFLIDAVGDFTVIGKVGLRVLQIHPDPQVEHQYRLKILLTASGSDQTGPASLSSIHQVVVQFANDQEIIDAKIIKNWKVVSLTTRSADQTFFADATKPFGLDQLDLPDNWKCAPGAQIDSYTCQTAVDDFDRDGYLDIAISSLQGKQYLLRSINGESFEDVTEESGLPDQRFFSHTTFATWIDYDNDGFPDLLLGKNMYHNERGQRFRLVTSSSGLRLSAATMGAVVVDFDCDGWLDLYVLNHHGDRGDHRIGFVEDDTKSGVPNQLWRNLGNGKFQDVTADAGVDGAARHSFAATWFYANEDRYPDLYLVNDFGRNCLFINRGNGKFDDVTVKSGVGDFANSMGVAAGDLDNDGSSEIYVANMFSKMGRRIISHVSASDYPDGVFRGIEGACAGSHLYKQSGSELVYEEISVEKSVNEVGWAYAPVFADFDADGLLDIYATSGFISVDRKKPDG